MYWTHFEVKKRYCVWESSPDFTFIGHGNYSLFYNIWIMRSKFVEIVEE